MALTIYRYTHASECVVNEPKHKKFTKKALRYFAPCQCPIWFYGATFDGTVYKRQTTHSRNWIDAQAFIANLDFKAKDQKVNGLSIGDAITDFLATKKGQVVDVVHQSYIRVLGLFKDYCAGRSVFYMPDLTLDLVERFNTATFSDLASGTKANQVAKLRNFLNMAYKRGWMLEGLGLRMESVAVIRKEADPFSEDEVKRILDECLNLKLETLGFLIAPETFRLLLRVQLEMGLRVGDACVFDPHNSTPSNRRLGTALYKFKPQKQRTKGTRKTHTIYQKQELLEEIKNCQWLSKTHPFAYLPVSRYGEMAIFVNKTMGKIGERSGVTDCRPHRLRDTFAVRLLLKGWRIQDVSKLLCHASVTTTEKYYVKWVQERYDGLDDLYATTEIENAGLSAVTQ